ncbi:TB2/DP1, HVA22 family [Oesophagostomum dentatum]|uniref:Receptor expression-enhancing protein n=1 Tax=Oesophagostomum dentatum TaxID=61180 RepID=A0A0B1SIH6_OESDE|nr:TB2/DP1, HVA22 family [Oesophagostomum dentatum]
MSGEQDGAVVATLSRVNSLGPLTRPSEVAFKQHAVRSPLKEDDTQWLIYWIVFAAFSIIDFSVFSSVPFYWLFKMSFLLYLYLPVFNGATVIYHSMIDPACSFVEGYFHPAEPKKNS